ncbi:MAG TPA: hypothetical protein VJB16_06305, partial [archaeon]|nr:hypothetical protein [archaeon]
SADQYCMAMRDSGRCRGPRVPDSMYCWRHAHLDPSSEYVLCASTDARGRQCGNSIKKSAASTNPYCNLHTRSKLGS